LSEFDALWRFICPDPTALLAVAPRAFALQLERRMCA
jgi:hypothetical protein